jgi:hypothetical protein
VQLQERVQGLGLRQAVKGTAVFSECGTWRYNLTREWSLEHAAPAVVIGANPSTATAEVDDPTIRLETGIARDRWGMGYYIKVNAYAFRATNPKDMWAAAKCGVDINGPKNDDFIVAAMDKARYYCGRVIAAWGSIVKPERVEQIINLARGCGVALWAFGINPSGTPWHPLYKKLPAMPVLWALPECI